MSAAAQQNAAPRPEADPSSTAHEKSGATPKNAAADPQGGAAKNAAERLREIEARVLPGLSRYLQAEEEQQIQAYDFAAQVLLIEEEGLYQAAGFDTAAEYVKARWPKGARAGQRARAILRLVPVARYIPREVVAPGRYSDGLLCAVAQAGTLGMTRVLTVLLGWLDNQRVEHPAWKVKLAVAQAWAVMHQGDEEMAEQATMALVLRKRPRPGLDVVMEKSVRLGRRLAHLVREAREAVQGGGEPVRRAMAALVLALADMVEDVEWMEEILAELWGADRRGAARQGDAGADERGADERGANEEGTDRATTMIEIRVEAAGAVVGLLGEASPASASTPAHEPNPAAASAPAHEPNPAAASAPGTEPTSAAVSATAQPDPWAPLPWPDSPQSFSLDQVADVLWGDPGKSMLMHHLQQNRAVIGGTYIPPTRGVIVFKSEPPDLRVHHFCRLCTVRAFPHQTDPDERHGPLCPFYRGHRPHIHDEHCAENPLCLPLYRGPLDEPAAK